MSPVDTGSDRSQQGGAAKPATSRKSASTRKSTTATKTAAAKKAPTRKAAPKKGAVRQTTTVGKPAAKAPVGASQPKPITPEKRQRMIALGAHLRAERRGFAPGGEVQDWLESEKEVDTLLLQG
jgi:hypothetical protein